MNNNNYVCSVCGAPAQFDGRCGDGPYLVCKCSKNTMWIEDRCGGYEVNLNGAEPISAIEYINRLRKEKK